MKWITKLIGYDYIVKYKPGCENRVADALSRVDLPEFESISAPTVPWLSDLRTYSASPAGQQFFSKVSQNPHFTCVDGIYYKGRVYIPEISELRSKFLSEIHSSPTGGHSGVKSTLSRISATFYWPRLKEAVKMLVKMCQHCQQYKTSTQKPFWLLTPLPIPTLSMDFITHLPLPNGKSTIWVIVDRLTKFAHFISLPPKFTAAHLASVFLNDIL